jgi:hypothetical protein
MDNDAQAALRRQSGLFARITLLLASILAAGIAICMASALLVPRDPGQLALLHALYWFPSLFYLWVLIAVRRAFVDIAAGALFGPAVERGLRHLGWCLVAGGILSTLLAPWVRSGPLPAGFVDGRTQVFGLDSVDLVLALVGVAVLLLSRLLNLAGAYRSRSQALEAELKGFL